MKKPTNDKKKIALVVLLAALVIGGVAFAALSSTLNINGTAHVRSSDFQVEWESDEGAAGADSWACTTSGQARVVSVSNDKDTATISASFLETNDAVTCIGIAHNYGTVDAELGSVNSNLSNLTNADGNGGDITADLTYGNNSAYAADDALATGATQDWKVVLTYTGAGNLSTAGSPVNFSYTIPYIEQ